MRFWFDRGVDGFRIDVIWFLIKEMQLRDNPLDPDWKEGDLPTCAICACTTKINPRCMR